MNDVSRADVNILSHLRAYSSDRDRAFGLGRSVIELLLEPRRCSPKIRNDLPSPADIFQVTFH